MSLDRVHIMDTVKQHEGRFPKPFQQNGQKQSFDCIVRMKHIPPQIHTLVICIVQQLTIGYASFEVLLYTVGGFTCSHSVFR